MLSQPSEKSPDPSDRPINDDVIDRLLGECLERCAEVAPLSDPSELADLLPADHTDHHAFLLGELVKLDMAAAAEAAASKGGTVPRLERYLTALPQWFSAERMPFDLVVEELQLRREAGEDPPTDEFATRFPQHAAKLRRFTGAAVTATSGKPKPPPGELALGTQIDDFELIQTLGKGAFAHVYLARQVSMQRLVALKVSRGSGDEPQALAQFDHPNIVRVYDQRFDAPQEAHLLYMQYLPGGTLSDVVKLARCTPHDERDGGLILEAVDMRLLEAAQPPPDRSAVRAWLRAASWPMAVAWLGVQLARALDEAHEHGVMHRDVKPANVLLSAEGVPKLADFNVSFAGEVARADAAETLGGSIGYMAPEHLRAISGAPGTDPSDVAEPADLYSLGILLWELWQGQRPFVTRGGPASWTDAVVQQTEARSEELLLPLRVGDGSERVLEETLRQALSPSIEDRFSSGAELAGRLRLALHPEAATLFDPEPRSWRRRVLQFSPWLVAALAVLLPNFAAAIFNYCYNEREIIQAHEEMRGDFQTLAAWVNGVLFPFGVVLTVWYAQPMATAVAAARRGASPHRKTISSLIDLGKRAALIGSLLWGLGSLIYPITLSVWHPEFPLIEALHFCGSLLICGGVAAVYPYFIVLLLTSTVYYPRVLRRSMNDPDFDRHAEKVRRDGVGFLLAAAMIPLLSIALLVSRETMATDVIMVAVVATAVGLLASFFVYQHVLSVWEKMRQVLSQEHGSAPPGIAECE